MREFNVGDVVHIVDQPVKIAPGWAYEMNNCCGQEVIITSIHAGSIYVRSTNPDNVIDFAWSWTVEAFREFYEDEFSEIEGHELMALLEVM